MSGLLDHHIQNVKLDHYLKPHTKTNSKQMKNLNVRPETIKLPEANIHGKLLDVSFSDFFFRI